MERPASSTRGPQARAYVSSPSNVRGEVILWADTFNNYFLPHTAQAALEVLEDAGFRVRVPRQHLCCGRPLYDFGMLEEAKTYLRKVLSALATDIAAGTPVVCLEPSCASVFCDELVNLFPNEDAARRLSKQVILFPDFLQKVGYQPGKLTGKAIVHGHCHHKALWSMHPEQQLLQSAGLDAHVLDSGCCGLAGSFGYEAGHHDISVAIGEHALFPPVRAASRDTLIVSDGFSCRQQIAHGTPRQALHTAEVLQMALHPQPKRKRNRFIETGHTQPNPGYPVLTALAAGLGLLGAGIFLLSRTNGQRPTSNASKPVSTR